MTLAANGSSPPGVPAVLVREATVTLGQSVLLDQLSLGVEAGAIVGIGGENGAGKSTLLRAIAGLIDLDGGTIEVLGHSPRSLQARSQVGCAIDTPAFYAWMSARGHLRTAQLMAGEDDRAEVRSALERFGLGDTGRKPIFRFSQGMKKRLALAQASLGQPALLLVDEPTNALDPAGREAVWSWLIAERQAGRSVVVVSHRGADREHCDQWFDLVDGRLHDA